MKILVTGSKGFIGKNLIIKLRTLPGIDIFEYDLENTREDLINYIRLADFIIHLAGVNRPEKVEEYKIGNADLTKLLITILNHEGKTTPILMSSSIQAEYNNPYGISKKKAEKYLLEYQNRGGKVFIYRLTNVFGKWCNPNYNSVIATFCYNICRKKNITVSDRNKILQLIYIDDVIDEFVRRIFDKNDCQSVYFRIPISYDKALGDIEDILMQFSQNRKSLKIQNFSDEFVKKLYATYISYLPQNDFAYDLNVNVDNRGILFEVIKSDCFGQIFISITKPGITRGNHYHNTKPEKFCVISGKAKIKFKHLVTEKVITYEVMGAKPKVIDIPTGYIHNISNVGNDDLITLFWSGEVFNSEKTDTYIAEI